MMMTDSRYGKLIAIGVFSAVGLIAPAAMAQITPDASLGAESSRLTPNVLIQGGNADRVDGGATRGGNLFHSFSQLNVADGQRLYFANPTGIQTIFTRVTGNTLSNINGTLGVDGAANLFLLNPNGILFGQNARLDLRSSFVGTTANSIRFGDQGTFSATNPQTVPLLTIQPSALVFTQVNPGKIVSESIAPVGQSPTGRNLLGLRVPDGQNLLLIGGDVEIDGKGIYSGLNAQGGRIELGGLASAGEVAFNNFQLTFPTELVRSNVFLSNRARVSTVGIGGGNLLINANQLAASTGAVLVAGTEGAGDAGDITVNANAVNMIGTKSFDTSGGFYNQVRNATATGNAGNIIINANELTVSDRAVFNTGTLGRGKGGSSNINVRDTVTLDEGYIAAPVTSSANAQGGDVRIKASSVVIKNGSQIDLTGDGRGNTGDVVIDARDRIEIESFGTTGSAIFNGIDEDGIGQSGEIRLTTGSLSLLGSAQLTGSTGGQGNAGNIVISARDQIIIDPAGIPENGAGIRSNVERGATGQGGDILITTGLLSLKNSGQLASLTYGKGNAGNVVVNAKDILFQGRYIEPDGSTISSGIIAGVDRGGIGNGGKVRIMTNSLTVQDGASITNFVRGQGNGGNTLIEAGDRVELLNGNIRSSVVQGGIGNSGDIQIRTGNLNLLNQSRIDTSTNGIGNAGSILLEANTLTMGNSIPGAKNYGSSISTDTARQGNAGNITINIRDNISLDDGSIGSNVIDSGTFDGADFRGDAARFRGKGQGGDIKISSGTLSLLNNSLIDSSTNGEGDAGDLSISARDSILLDNGSLINTSTSSFFGSPGIGNAGSVNIDTRSLSILNKSSILSNTDTGARGNAGNINIRATDQVVLDSGNLSTSVSSSSVIGKGGAIQINTRVLSLLNNASLLTASFASGDAGNISIQASDRISITGGAFLSSATLGQGNAGNIILRTGELLMRGNNLSGGIGISSAAFRNSPGRGGDIDIFANSVSMTDKAIILAAANGTGKAGDITIQARDRVRLFGESGIFASNTGTGQGGNVDIRSGILSLNQSLILAETFSGDGGNVTLNLKVLAMRDKSGISTNGGNAQAGGNGGDITINASAIAAPARENSDISANAFTGRGGNVRINADAVFGIKARSRLTPESDITASSDRGVQGTIAITQPDVQPEQGLLELPGDILDASNQIGQSCPNARNNRSMGTFVVSGRGSLPSSPLEPLADNPNLPSLAELKPDDRSIAQAPIPRVTASIVEAQGWRKTPDGKVVLIAQPVQFMPTSTNVNSCPGSNQPGL
jgi:filamentous hemagglutinin family protein